MAEENRTQNPTKLEQTKDLEPTKQESSREKKILNLVTNTGIILMGTLMGGLTEVMMNLTGTLASGMAETFGAEKSGEDVKREIKQKRPEIDDKVKSMVSDVRKDLYAQMEEKRKEIEPFLSDPAFDVGPKKIDEYDFSLPKLTEELDDNTIAQYAYLLVSEDPNFSKMFGELTQWMNTLPKFPSDNEKK